MPDEPTTVAEVVVTGKRYTYTYVPTRFFPPPAPPPVNDEFHDPEQNDPIPECVDMSNASPTDRLKQLIRFAAADIRSKILAMPNQAMEYGSLIYIDASGQIGHTPLIQSPDFRAAIDYGSLPKINGNPDYSKVVGIIHSHPRWLPNASGTLVDWYTGQPDPSILMRPSNDYNNNGTMIGDWITTDAIIANGAPSNLAIFVAGYNGTTLGLNEYSNADNRGSTTKNPINVDILPPCSVS